MGNKNVLLYWHLLKRFFPLQGSANTQIFQPAILNPPASCIPLAKITVPPPQNGQFYSYVTFNIKLYPLMEVAILETSHLILLVVKFHQMRNCFNLHFVFTSVTPKVLTVVMINPYPTVFPYGNGMVLHFYQQQERSTTKTVHKVINKGLKTYV